MNIRRDEGEMMRRCAFLTLEDPAEYVIDDDLTYEPLLERGWLVEAVPWRRPGMSWSDFDAVVIRSSWDYQDAPGAFLRVLADIERSGVPLLNGLDTVRWNLRKTYLRDLAAAGVAVVPTLWQDRLEPGDLASVFAEIGADEIIVKPVVSANADGAFRLDARKLVERASEVELYYRDRPLMAQPFVRAVTDEGEYSLFYFNGEYSHAVLKTPKAGDFRVQEEHGGLIRPASPGNALHALGTQLLDVIGGVIGGLNRDGGSDLIAAPPLYARADFVRSDKGNAFWLMELELIEPALYFRMDGESPRRFARALDERIERARDGAW